MDDVVLFDSIGNYGSLSQVVFHLSHAGSLHMLVVSTQAVFRLPSMTCLFTGLRSHCLGQESLVPSLLVYQCSQRRAQ